MFVVQSLNSACLWFMTVFTTRNKEILKRNLSLSSNVAYGLCMCFHANTWDIFLYLKITFCSILVAALAVFLRRCFAVCLSPPARTKWNMSP